MSNTSKVRFADYSDDWEQRKFSEVFSFLQNNTLSRADLSAESGAAKNVHYGDVLTKFGEYLDVKKEYLAFIPTETVANKYKSSFLQNGDVIIADTAEDETAGKCCEIANSEGSTLVSGLHTIPCRPNQEYASGFLGYYMNSPAYHNQLLPLMQGTKVTSVSKTAISDTRLMYPVSVDEQRRISQYLLSIDNLITLRQREYEKLVSLKSACLDKLFPKNGSKVPELRFAGFTGEWEQRKVGEITFAHPFKPFLAEPTLDGKIEVIQQGNIPVVGFANGNACLNYKPITLFGDHTVSIYKAKSPFFVASDGVKILSPADEITGDFFYYLLERYKPTPEGYKRHYTILQEKDCFYPQNTAEQEALSSFLRNLDNLITLHQRKSKKLKQLKQSMLYSMFV